MNNYDLIIIGGGAGAFAAAIKANQLGAKTLMVNKGLPLGGTCVNVGCVPSKALLWLGEVRHLANNHSLNGLEEKNLKINFEQIIKEELSLVEMLRKEKYHKVLKTLQNVTFIKGRAKFVSKNEIEVNKNKFKAPKFIIATGSTATIPPIQGIKDIGYLTHVEALRIKKQPKSLIIIGAGPLGLEFAQMYARLGTKVTLLQRGPKIFPVAEPELTSKLTKILTSEGIVIKTQVEIKNAKFNKGQKVLSCIINGVPKKISGQEILLATGKTPNSQEIGLEEIGVKVNDRQAIEVNKYFQTTQKHIFAVGDVVNLPLRLETTAGREGTLASENALKNTKHFIDYHSVPYAIFTDPQIASVGYTEENQTKTFGICACRTVTFDHVPKALILRRSQGLIKMNIDPKTKVILGVHILGANASEIIAQAMTLIKNKNTIDDLINSMPVFPTLSEALKIVAMSYYNNIDNFSCCI